MEIVKLLKDYSKTPLEKKINEFLSNSLDSTICYEPIKNKNFIVQYMMPLHDFVAYNTSIPCCDVRRISS